jgi:hypothetical protein
MPNSIIKSCLIFDFKRITTYTENISLFRIFQFINRSRESISVQIDPENISAKVQALAHENRLINLIKTGINGFLRLSKLGTSIVTVYQKKQ